MKINKVTFQLMNDFTALMECEFCGHKQMNHGGYNDEYYHTRVIPEMKCENCKKSTNSENLTELRGEL